MFRSWVTHHTAGNEDLVVQLLNISSMMNGDSMMIEGMYQAFKKYVAEGSHQLHTQPAKTNQKAAPGSRSTFLPGLQGVCQLRLPLLQSPHLALPRFRRNRDAFGCPARRTLAGGYLYLPTPTWAELLKVPEPPHSPL